MADASELIQFLKAQAKLHEEQEQAMRERLMEQQKQHQEQQKKQQEQMLEMQKLHQEEMFQQQERLQQCLEMLATQAREKVDAPVNPTPAAAAAIPPFAAFDSSSELWPDYWSRFCTFLAANAVPENRMAHVFLTNQTPAVYRQLANLAAQESPATEINKLTKMRQPVTFLRSQILKMKP